jgi:hypothetical protein
MTVVGGGDVERSAILRQAQTSCSGCCPESSISCPYADKDEEDSQECLFYSAAGTKIRMATAEIEIRNWKVGARRRGKKIPILSGGGQKGWGMRRGRNCRVAVSA